MKDAVVGLLKEKGYEVFLTSGAFDIVARNGNPLVIKLLKNIDSLLFEHASVMRNFSCCISASPLVIGERTSKERLEDLTIYERYGIPCMNLYTFQCMLDGIPVYHIKDKGGKYAYINPEKLKRARKQLGLTQESLARSVKTSKKTIYLHEKKTLKAELSLIFKLEKALGTDVRQSISLSSLSSFLEENKTEEKPYIASELERIGFDVLPIGEIFAEVYLRDVSMFASRYRSRYMARILSHFLSFYDKQGFLITRTSRKRVIENLPALSEKEVRRIRSKEELIERLELMV
jgi:putative transcriptional regulator